MKLHYSQTAVGISSGVSLFDYHMKLHYSQTDQEEEIDSEEFDYHMKLHYSQTSIFKSCHYITCCILIWN